MCDFCALVRVSVSVCTTAKATTRKKSYREFDASDFPYYSTPYTYIHTHTWRDSRWSTTYKDRSTHVYAKGQQRLRFMSQNSRITQSDPSLYV